MSYKVIQSNPAANTPTDLYTVPTNQNAIVSTLSVCNHGTVDGEYTIRIRPNGDASAPEHLLAFDVFIAISETAFITVGIAISEGDVITVEGTTADITFMAFVNEVIV